MRSSMNARHLGRPSRLAGTLIYAVAIAVVVTLLGRGSGGGSSPLFRWPSSPLFGSGWSAMLPSFGDSLLADSVVERFFASRAAAGGPDERPAPAAAPIVRRLKKVPRTRPRGLASPMSDPPGSLDRSELAASSAVATFGDDPVPPPALRDLHEEAMDEDGGVRFSKLLESRTREELFLACRLRREISFRDGSKPPPEKK